MDLTGAVIDRVGYAPAPSSPAAGDIAFSMSVEHSTWAAGHRIAAVVVDMDGKPIGELPSALVADFENVLDDEGSGNITVSMFDPGLTHLVRPDGSGKLYLLVRGIQVWLDGRMAKWLLPAQGRKNWVDGTVELRCVDWMHLLKRRVFGRANRPSWLPNPDFADGLRYWVPAPAGATPPTFSLVASTLGDSPWMLKATGHGDTDSYGSYVSYSARNPAHTYTTSLVYKAFRWVWLDEGATVDRNRLVRFFSVDHLTGETFDEVTPDVSNLTRGGWQRLTGDLLVPPNRYVRLGHELFGPQLGDVFFARGDIQRNEATTVPAPGATRPVIAQRVAEYMQDPSQGKSGLGFGYDCPDEGDIVWPAWEHAKHQGWDEAMRAFLVEVGADHWVAHPTSRSKIYSVRAGGRGVHHPELRLTLDRGTVSVGAAEDDALSSATSVIYIGDSTSDFTVEEGGAADTSRFDGLVLEEVRRAPQETPIGDLDNLAADAVDTLGDVQSDQQASVPLSWWWLIEEGDTLPAQFRQGVLAYEGTARITRKKARPPDRLVDLTWEHVG